MEAFVTVDLLNLWTVDAVIVDSHNGFARSLIAISLEQRDLELNLISVVSFCNVTK